MVSFECRMYNDSDLWIKYSKCNVVGDFNVKCSLRETSYSLGMVKIVILDPDYHISNPKYIGFTRFGRISPEDRFLKIP